MILTYVLRMGFTSQLVFLKDVLTLVMKKERSWVLIVIVIPRIPSARVT
jgi:hypothetical protein